MTDFDADEPVAPLPVRKKKFWTTDRIIGWSGVAVAMAAAFFPWYVFVNEDKFGLAALRAIVSGDPAAPSRRAALQGNKNGIPERKTALASSEDDIVTGTVAAVKEPGTEVEQALPAQASPTAPRNFRLLKVIKGQAMIEDGTGIFVVRKGDVLPDRTKVADLQQRDGGWVLVTDGGKTYAASEN